MALKGFEPFPWKNEEAGDTPIEASDLKEMEERLAKASGPFVTALPGSPKVGEKVLYVVNEAAGHVWECVYTGKGECPWQVLGGEDLYAEYVGTGEQALETTVEAAQSTNAPVVELPNLKVEGVVRYGCGRANVSAVGVEPFIWLAINGATSLNYNRWSGLVLNAAGNAAPMSGSYKGVFAAKAKVAAYYSRRLTAGTASFFGMYLDFRPLRVG